MVPGSACGCLYVQVAFANLHDGDCKRAADGDSAAFEEVDALCNIGSAREGDW